MKKLRKKRSKGFCFLMLFFIAGFLFNLSACSDEKPQTSEKKIEASSKKVKKKSSKKAVKEKTPKEMVAYHYDPKGKKDPFKPFIKVGKKISEDMLGGRPLTPLQKYTLAELSLVAIITSAENPKAMVEDPKGDGYILRKGTLIGDRYGEVVDIKRNEIVVIEKEVDPSSGEIIYSEVSMILHKLEEEEL